MWNTADSNFDFKRYIASRKAKVEYKTALAEQIAQRVALQRECRALKDKASASHEIGEETGQTPESIEAYKFEKAKMIIAELESKLPKEDEEHVPNNTVFEGGRCIVVESDSDNYVSSDAD